MVTVDHRPVTCARCKSRQWDAPRQRGHAASTQRDAMDAILARLDALEATVARRASGQRQPAGTRQKGSDGRTLDYDAF